MGGISTKWNISVAPIIGISLSGNYRGKTRNNLSGTHEKATSNQKIAGVLIKLDRSQEALQYVDSAHFHGSRSQAEEVLRDIARTRALAYVQLNNYQAAYQQEELFASLQASFLNNSISNQVSELNTKYETERKEKEIPF